MCIVIRAIDVFGPKFVKKKKKKGNFEKIASLLDFVIIFIIAKF